mmetsp:Transcript_34926/g.88624  ORF Transcript_34926/g.88624 Transcript_34926/m.88624 type:complete len:228 (-) Transcript_34926:2-685(-)
MMSAQSADLAASAACSVRSAGSRRSVISVTPAMYMAVGNESLLDWPMFTWSFGWTGVFEPTSPPSIWIARFEMTSFTFMLDCVPLPVWKTTSGKWSASVPAMTSSAAATMAPPTFLSMSPASMLYCVAHFLSTPYALITGSGMRAAEPPIGKFWSERCVCAPQSTSVLTSIGPKASLSVRVESSRLSGSRIAAVARRASIGPAMPRASLAATVVGPTMPRVITDVPP